MNKKKFSKTHSPELSIFAFLLYSTSATAYRILLDQDLLSLPSICTLNKITRKVDSRSSLNDNSYLKLRCSQLDQIHRNVIMLIDEIYITKRVELSHGDLIGLASNNEPASTLLCFMIRSCAGSYKDIVGIYPMSNITADIQHSCFQDVVRLVYSRSFNVIAESVDNASLN